MPLTLMELPDLLLFCSLLLRLDIFPEAACSCTDDLDEPRISDPETGVPL